MPLRDIKTVIDEHVNELMSMPGVTGVFVGELENGTPCILVFILQESADLRRKIPEKLDGHPVKIEVTGEFKPLGDSL